MGRQRTVEYRRTFKVGGRRIKDEFRDTFYISYTVYICFGQPKEKIKIKFG